MRPVTGRSKAVTSSVTGANNPLRNQFSSDVISPSCESLLPVASALAGTVTEIGIQRAFARGAAGKNGGSHLPQIGPSLTEGRRTFAHEGGALLGEDLVGLATGRGGNGRH